MRDNLGLSALAEVRILHRYDIDPISEEVYERALGRILSEAPVDMVSEEEVEFGGDTKVFAVEYLPGSMIRERILPSSVSRFWGRRSIRL